MASFSRLGVKENYIKGLVELGIKTPTDIQEKVIPVLLKSKTDLIGLAQTGTGKTAAFGLPMLHSIDPSKDTVQGLILSPTRELAQQIQKQLFKFTKHIDQKIFVEGVYGGQKIEIQMKALKRTTHIIVATPGRLVDLVERKAIKLSDVKTIVLDEADEMLSMGFKTDLNKILKYTSGISNTWLFSATMPEEIKRIVSTYMDPSAVRVAVNENSIVNANITHQFVKVEVKDKENLIIDLLNSRRKDRGIVFCRTKAGTQKLMEVLKKEGLSVGALEGDMQQRDREKTMRAFKNGTTRILISTDVSARGIDVSNLAFVLHHQLPEHIEYYTHRSGRTARAGNTGDSIALITPGELPKIHELQKALGIRFKELKKIILR